MAESPHLGIPQAVFIDDIKSVAPTQEAAEKLLQEKQEIMSKYRLLESHLIEKEQQLKNSRPEVADNLTAVQKLESMAGQGEKLTHFQVADSVYGTAKIDSKSCVALWLGANLMVEYPFDQAKKLLQGNLDTLDQQISSTEENLSFLRDQIITTEVTMSRLVNHLISIRQTK